MSLAEVLAKVEPVKTFDYFDEVRPPKRGVKILYVLRLSKDEIKIGSGDIRRLNAAKTYHPHATLIAWDSEGDVAQREDAIHRAYPGKVPYRKAGHEVKLASAEMCGLVACIAYGLPIKMPVVKHKKFRESTPKPALMPERPTFKGTNKKVKDNENRSYDQRYVSNASSLRSSR